MLSWVILDKFTSRSASISRHSVGTISQVHAESQSEEGSRSTLLPRRHPCGSELRTYCQPWEWPMHNGSTT